ncbi:MAG: PQQ-binding-like beta-propeller repeat protein, partial [Planctomycetes bacterium]|nr:PQQ-binding-like beta-propeller repeat protein [Planctomycetota bacterium]
RNVLVARENIHALDLYGKVSIDRYDGSRLPYTESLVNLLIDSSEKTTVPHEEILRVLAPGGVAFVDGKKIVKPWPADIDQWTHYLHSADNNAVAADRQIDIPRSFQWVSGPRWGRSHEEMASMSAAVSEGGRVFFIVDEAPLASIRYQGNWKLVARDAFNGTLLWKKDIAQWNDVLRHFRSGPVHLPRRLVAVGDRVYVTDGLAGPVTVLDGATGETVTVLKGTERTDEILIDGGVAYLVVGTSEVYRRGGGLYRRGEPEPTDFRFITAINLESGKRLWKKDFDESEFLLPLSLAVKGKRLYYQSTLGIVCLDTASGQQQWKTARETPGRRMAFSAPTLVATDDVVLLADRDAGKSEENKPSTGKIEWGVHGWNEGGFPRKGASTLRAYSATDGKELWSAPCSEGYNSPVDIFVIDGTVWVGAGFNGYDLATGESRGKINTAAPRVGMPHHRCYRNKASERFIFTGKSGIEVLDPEKGWLSNNSWVRGTCQYGIMPANGLLYAPPDACACFLTLKAPGFFAVAPQRDESGHMPFPDEPVLEKGPLYGKPIPVADAKADDWPMYRHDVTRSGAIGGSIPEQPKKQWSVSIGGRLTQPVTAAGTVLVASIDTQTIHALAADDGGRELWRFTAGGRIDSSPTIYQGTVLFGSADGWVYCLGATDGRLVWRFQAAPTQRLIAAYGQLESAWPVHGSVLVQNDIVYVTAGRSTYTDGGIVLYRLDPASGKELSKTMLYHLDPDSGKQLTTEGGFNMEGTTTDLLTGDGDSVYLKYFCFNREGQRAPSTKPHLFAIAGLLGEEWFVRSYWVLGTDVRGAGWGGWANTANANPAGRILCFNDEVVYGYGRTTVSNGAVGHRADAYHLFGRSRKVATPPPPSKSTSSKGGRRGKPTPAKGEIVWSDTESLTARAMVLAADRLVVAGPVDLGEKTEGILSFKNEPEALAAFQGQKDICLRIISTADGKTISECKLDALPVFDGMSAAGGKIYVSLKDGTVVCFGK